MLVSKTLQQLANGLLFEMKEDYMKLVNPFISENLEALKGFFDDISVSILFDLSLWILLK